MTQFSLRAFLGCISAIAVYLGLSLAMGWATSAVFVVASGLIWWALTSRSRRWMYAIRGVASCLGLVGVWLSGIDYRWSAMTCPDCRWVQEDREVRVLGLPIWPHNDYPEVLVYKALRDLGLGCQHREAKRQVFTRWRGGVYAAFPKGPRSIHWVFFSDPFYTDAVSAELRLTGTANPGLAKRVQQRVIVDKDSLYLTSGLMTDHYVAAAYSTGQAKEARAWLADAPECELRDLECSCRYDRIVGSDAVPESEDWEDISGGYGSYSESRPPVPIEIVRNSLARSIDHFYAAGVEEVIVIWVRKRYAHEDTDRVHLSIELGLPTGDKQRGTLFQQLSEVRKAKGTSGTFPDYGQQFVSAWDFFID